MFRHLFIFILLSALAHVELLASWHEPLKDYLIEAQSERGIPALAFVLVSEDKVLFEGGSGMLSGKAINAQTVFPAPALTPALSSLMVARMVDAGLLQWNDPLSRLNAGAHVGEPVPRLLQMMQMTAGIPSRADEMADEGWAKPQDLFTIARQLPRTAIPGERFETSELSYAAAVYAASRHASNRSAQDFVHAYRESLDKWVLEPLGLGATLIDTEQAMAPVNGLSLNMHDLGKWLQAELSSLQPGGFVSPYVQSIRHAPTEQRGARNLALGWHLQYYQQQAILAKAGQKGRDHVIAGIIPVSGIGFALWLHGDAKSAQAIIEELPFAVTELSRKGN